MSGTCQHDPFTTPDAVFTVDGRVGCGPMLVVYTSRRCRSRPPDAPLTPRFISLEGELDARSGEHLASVLIGMVGDSCEVVVDVSKVTFVDTHGLAGLGELRDRTTQRGGRVWLHEPHGAVLRLLDLWETERFDVCSTETAMPRARRPRADRLSARSRPRHRRDGVEVISPLRLVERPDK